MLFCVFTKQSLPQTGIKRQYHDVNDITRGEECVSIPIVCGEDGVLPPPFHYISQNTTFQDACINLSLARIGDENCCSGCFGDCLAEPLPCACARETGGDFAYTRDGLLKEGFLDACVSMLREPLKQPHFYCKGVCPIEQIMKGVSSAKPDACKGHLIKKFIKECWIKCGCTRNCGNRVVQRGITRKLQASEVTYYRLRACYYPFPLDIKLTLTSATDKYNGLMMVLTGCQSVASFFLPDHHLKAFQQQIHYIATKFKLN